MPEAINSVDPLWSVDQVSEYLGKSPRWIYAALARPDDQPGSIPHFRVGRSPRFDAQEIAAWARASCPPLVDWRAWQARADKASPIVDMAAKHDTLIEQPDGPSE
ncbi:MAG: helix-turn-helix domain-containing protein [Planctomycetota bacterium]|nr:helix-turn-helix domain-containing protein [Planctomycetota bacterium]